MDTKHLVSVEKWTLALAAAAVGFALFVFGGKMALGVTLGAGLMCLNAYVLRRLGERAKSFAKPSAAVLLFNVKMAVLIALCFLVVRYLPVDPAGFLAGLAVFPVAIVATAIRHQFSLKDTSNG
jgi:ATP synthase I chain